MSSKKSLYQKLIKDCDSNGLTTTEIDNLFTYLDENYVEKSFSDSIFEFLRLKKMKAPDLYKNCEVDRKTFSKLFRKDYRPSKNTSLCLCIGLHLTIDETNKMLNKLGYALSSNSYFDLVVSYFLKQGIYDIYTINLCLSEMDQDLLGTLNKVNQ